MAHTDADGCDFPVGDPGSREALAPAGGDAEAGADADEQFLQRAQIKMQVLAVLAKVEDGIADKLAGAVVSGLAAAIDLNHGVGKVGGAAEAGLVRGAANGVNGVVLEEEELIRDRACVALCDEAVLEGQGLFVGDAAQPLDGEGVGNHLAVLENRSYGSYRSHRTYEQ
jgi:hypothetical protein